MHIVDMLKVKPTNVLDYVHRRQVTTGFHIYRVIVQLGRTLALGARGCVFKSRSPDHNAELG